MKKQLCFVLTVLLMLCGCQAAEKAVTKELFAMDTVMHLTAYTQNDQPLAQAEAEIRRLEQLLSVTLPQSDLYRLNHADGQWVTLSDETVSLVTLAKTYADQTQGRFDPTVYPAVAAWGFLDKQYTLPTEELLTALQKCIDYTAIEIDGNRVRLPKGMGIDLGAIAKGYAADQVKAVFDQAGVSGILSLGGNVLTIGQKPNGQPFSVAIQDPKNANQILGTLTLNGGQAAVTSGDYQRYFEQNGVRYHHILDPKTASPAVSDLTSVTVIADSAAAADAYATALFIAGKDTALTLAETWSIQAVLVTKEKQIICTPKIDFTLTHAQYTIETR
ncbi:MAG: FAD:protein FMN transferase [Clostridia bacterium]|nr:FAD:protein FMN transferase [Clostridia bacterium]